jgi:hypothetical protein
LGLTATGLIMPDSKIIEPMIAISILFVAIENIYNNKINASRLAVILA